MKQLSREVFDIADGPLTHEEASAATRLYLYEHQYFHHKAEMFSTRLEVSHRKNIYLQGQLPLYVETMGAEDHLEEALAEAYALKTVKKRLKNEKWDWPSQKRGAFIDAIAQRVNDADREYERGSEILATDRYHALRHRFAETIFARSPVHVTGRPEKIWSIFNQGFRGLANRLSDFKYLVRSDSTLSRQLDLESA